VFKDKTALVRFGLETLIAAESGKRLGRLEGNGEGIASYPKEEATEILP